LNDLVAKAEAETETHNEGAEEPKPENSPDERKTRD
jgi:hypothetical protein